MELKFNSDTRHRKQWFTGLSFSHPAKMSLPLQFWIIENYTKEGEVILDPMAGSGTAMVGCSMGRDVIVIDLEQKFVNMMNKNWDKIKQRGSQLGYSMGKCQIIQGDARNLEGVLADKIITSPPYAHRSVQGDGKLATEKFENTKYSEETYIHSEHRDTQTGRYLPASFNNIGLLPYGAIDKIVSSPPYAETGVGDWQTGRAEFQAWVINELATKGYVEWQGKRYTEAEWRAMNHGRIDGRTTKGVHKHPTDGYGEAGGQIGNLSYGEIDKIITSPPYEGSLSGISDEDRAKEADKLRAMGYKINPNSADNKVRGTEYSASPENIGNLKSDTYLEAMLQVYQQCFSVLKSGGLMVLVVKNFIRNKQVIRLDTDTIKLCEQAGFTFKERHYRKLPSQSFWRVIYHKKFPDVEQIDKEDVLIFAKKL